MKIIKSSELKKAFFAATADPSGQDELLDAKKVAFYIDVFFGDKAVYLQVGNELLQVCGTVSADDITMFAKLLRLGNSTNKVYYIKDGDELVFIAGNSVKEIIKDIRKMGKQIKKDYEIKEIIE